MGGEEHPRAPGASEEAAEILGLAAPGQSWGAGLALLLSRGCPAQLRSLGWTSPPPDSPRGHLICCVLEPVVCLGPPRSFSWLCSGRRQTEDFRSLFRSAQSAGVLLTPDLTAVLVITVC